MSFTAEALRESPLCGENKVKQAGLIKKCHHPVNFETMQIQDSLIRWQSHILISNYFLPLMMTFSNSLRCSLDLKLKYLPVPMHTKLQT